MKYYGKEFMTYRRFKVDKLIRDNLPEMMRDQGIEVHEEVMDDCQYIYALKQKLLEEAEEVAQASDPEDLLEELADAMEVIQSLAKTAGFSMQQLEKVRLKKRKLKGGFDQKIYTHFVELEENSNAIDYYLSKPDQYPEA